ncbi:MAG: sialate O-acetylesterase [Planctomycetes bacterium]|nr:sialate O-acetylesterase [Planctomycetota bacterium]
MLVSIAAAGSPAPRLHQLHAAEPVRVFILAGQSNMEGKGKVSLLEHQIAQPETRSEFQHLQRNGKWVERDDVWIKFLDRKGKLTVGYGSPGRIGPELEFGNVVGDRYDEQVLIIKTAWGGKSLYQDFRSPSAGEADPKILDRLLEQKRKRQPDTTISEVKSSFGTYYREMLDEVKNTLANLDEHFPEYENQGYELAGFVWFQGWNDMVNPDYVLAYEENMVHFIKDVRKDLGSPKLPFVIGQLGVGGVDDEKPNPRRDAFKMAQANAAYYPEFKGNVAVVKTDQFWDTKANAVFKKGWKQHFEEWEKIGSDYPFHYLGSVRTYSQIGKAFGEAILKLSN